MHAVAYKLLLHTKGGTSERLLREGHELTLGRDPEVELPLSDGRVSRRHATLRLALGELSIVDLGSRNGTLVDGMPLTAQTSTPLRASSVVRVGSAVLVLEPLQELVSEQPWCFDRGSFFERAEQLLQSHKASLGVLELAWDNPQRGGTTTAAEVRTPAGLQQLLARVVGSRGLVGAYESQRLLLVLPSCNGERLEEITALLLRQCEADDIELSARSALSRGERSFELLLGKCAAKETKREAPVAPQVVFRGRSHGLEGLLDKLDASDAPILVMGETGVGKDVLARTLHSRSKRRDKPYVPLNCAAFTETLFESELFGHERGAFTGAQSTKTGILESAAGGTVFFDEIGEMPLGLQAKLLRVVENREILRIGGLTTRPIDVRFVFATNRDLHHEIEDKSFRSDLFFRISSITLKLPPLRERLDEIEPLAQHFVQLASQRLGRPAPLLLPDTCRFLEGHAWPGNVRELKNTIDLAVLVLDGDVLRPSDLMIERYVPLEGEPGPSAAPATPAAAAREPAVVTTTTAALDELGALDHDERARIAKALEQAAYNQSAAAKILGMPRRTLVKRLTQYDFPRPRKREG